MKFCNWRFLFPPSGDRPEARVSTTTPVVWKFVVDAQVSEGTVKVTLEQQGGRGSAVSFRMTHDQTHRFISQLLAAADAIEARR